MAELSRCNTVGSQNRQRIGYPRIANLETAPSRILQDATFDVALVQRPGQCGRLNSAGIGERQQQRHLAGVYALGEFNRRDARAIDRHFLHDGCDRTQGTFSHLTRRCHVTERVSTFAVEANSCAFHVKGTLCLKRSMLELISISW